MKLFFVTAAKRCERSALARIAGLMLLIGYGAGHADVARAAGNVFYVRASAATIAGTGDGSLERPFDSLQAVEQASGPGDTIVVLAAPRTVAPLDGGIALKSGQILLGEAATLDRAARITNSGSRLNGDAIVLAPGAEVAGLLIEKPRRGGIYGRNVPDVNIHDNEVVGHNGSCTLGLIIEPITIPTSTPGIVIPQPLPLPNGWAGIMVDADSGSGGVTIHDNIVRSAACGDGVDLRLSGSARYKASIDGNTVHHLRQGPLILGYFSVLAIGMQALDDSRLDVTLDRNTQHDIGESLIGDIGLPQIDSEGVFATLSGRAELVADINRNTFYRGLGSWSANGLEILLNSGSPRATVQVRNSSFIHTPGDVMEGFNFGVGSYLDMKFDNVVAMEAVGAPIIQDLIRPLTYAGNVGDCLVMTSSGAGNTLLLDVRNSRFENCVNNGVTISSNAQMGTGSVERIHFNIENTRISANRFFNLKLVNLAPVKELTGRVQNSDLSHGHGVNLGLVRLGATPARAVLDFGGGELGSQGNNCFHGGAARDLEIDGFDVSLKHNWWGQASAPYWWRTWIVHGSAAFTPVAITAPLHC